MQLKIRLTGAFKAWFLNLLFVLCLSGSYAQSVQYPSIDKVRSDFKTLLLKPFVSARPSFQVYSTDSALIEKGFIYSQETERVPVIIYKPVATELKSFPVVIFLHGTGGNKEDTGIKDLLYKFSKIGIMGVAIDARYHGSRINDGAHGSTEYVEAIIKAWKNSDQNNQEHPFYLDTVFDLWKLTDYLTTRPDVDANRIGMMGISMGGIETWMAASVDTRIKVTVLDIAAQSFKWSLENNRWQGRAKTIWKAHEQAAKDLGDTIVNKKNVKIFWDKMLPKITEEFDCPSMLRLFAPRPLLILNNEKDANCPLPGAELAFKSAAKTYRTYNALNKLQMHVAPNEGHRHLPEHVKMAIDWFTKWL